MKTTTATSQTAGRDLECGDTAALPRFLKPALGSPLCDVAQLAACGGHPSRSSNDLPSSRSKLRPPQSGSELPHSRLRPALRTLQFVLVAALLAFVGTASAVIKQEQEKPVIPAAPEKQEEIPELRPPREELPPSAESRDLLPWFVGAGVAAILAAIVAWPKPPKKVVEETPAAIAKRQLRVQSDPLEVAQILRRYVIAAFPVPGEGVSTEEISDTLFAFIPSDPTLAHQVTEFLLACDAAKFAPIKDPGTIARAATGAADLPPGGAAEVATSLIDKIEKRRHRPVVEKQL